MAYIFGNLPWFILLLGALIFFHELGHFLVAKACGVKVLRFSLGFGPRLLGFRRGDTDYQVGLLPFGGYVKMLGEIPGVEIPAHERSRSFSEKPVWQRAAIASAGPIFNFILAFGVYAVMFTGTHTFGDTKLGIVSRGEPAWNAGVRPGDRIVAVNGEPISQWDELRDAIGTRPGEQLELTYERDGARRAVTISPEAREEANVFNETETRGRIGVSLQYVNTRVAIVDSQGPAALAGLRSGDRITKVQGRGVAAWHELRDAIGSIPEGEPVRLEIARGTENVALEVVPVTPPPDLDRELFSAADTATGYTGIVNKDTVIEKVEAGTPAERAGLQVGDRLLALRIKRPDGVERERPIGSWEIDLAAFSGVDARSEFTLRVQREREVLVRRFSLEERQETDELKNTVTRYVFGAENDPEATGTYTFERAVSPVEAVAHAARQTVNDATLIGKGLAMLVGGRLPLDSMGGPIMLFVIAEKTAKKGWEQFFRMMAVISVNLGLLNLLPIPVLDGGHLMFFGIEAIRRRPPSLRTREIANVVGLAILLMLMVWALKNDLLRYVLG